MGAETILTGLAAVFVIATLWTDRRGDRRLTGAQRTWLLIAASFCVASVLAQLQAR